MNKAARINLKLNRVNTNEYHNEYIPYGPITASIDPDDIDNIFNISKINVDKEWSDYTIEFKVSLAEKKEKTNIGNRYGAVYSSDYY